MDILGQWVTEECNIGADLVVQSSTAYHNYRFWAVDAGLKPWSLVVFGRKLKERFVCARGAKGVVYSGVQLKGAAGVTNPTTHTPIPKAKVLPLVPPAPV